MKRKFLLLLLLSNYLIGYTQLTTNQIAIQQPLKIKGDFLLKTNWDQWGIYTRYSPENQVLGCWSTALAQILYYHRLKPYGNVAYQCTKGYQIKDTLSKYELKWDSPQTAIRYSYLTAIAIGKDFGTEKYKAMVNPGPALEAHFDGVTVFYVCFTGTVPFSAEQLAAIASKERIKSIVNQSQIEEMIRKEIDQLRPVYFHMANFKTYGHSTVIDGYQLLDKKFVVHINYGAGGFRTGWYELFKPIDVVDDMRLRAFMTIRVKDR